MWGDNWILIGLIGAIPTALICVPLFKFMLFKFTGSYYLPDKYSIYFFLSLIIIFVLVVCIKVFEIIIKYIKDEEKKEERIEFYEDAVFFLFVIIISPFLMSFCLFWFLIHILSVIFLEIPFYFERWCENPYQAPRLLGIILLILGFLFQIFSHHIDKLI